MPSDCAYLLSSDNTTEMDVDIETPQSPEVPVYVDQQGRW